MKNNLKQKNVSKLIENLKEKVRKRHEKYWND